MAEVLPAIFFGYGNPMNAVAHNVYTEAWRQIGEETPKPKAILKSHKAFKSDASGNPDNCGRGLGNG